MRSRETLIDDLKACLSQVPAIEFAWLFGSQARGDARADSDIDIAIHGRPGGWPLFRDSLAALGDRVPTGQAHVVLLADAPPGLAHRVLRDGVLLVDRDPVARVRFSVRSQSMYQDMEHARRRYAAADSARARAGTAVARRG